LHAFRYWFNTSLKGKVADSVIRTAIGHMSQAMTDHYTAHPREDIKPIANIIRGVFDQVQAKVAP
jgi:integrase